MAMSTVGQQFLKGVEAAKDKVIQVDSNDQFQTQSFGVSEVVRPSGPCYRVTRQLTAVVTGRSWLRFQRWDSVWKCPSAVCESGLDSGNDDDQFVGESSNRGRGDQQVPQIQEIERSASFRI